MRAVIQSAYGNPADVLRVADIPDPVPGPREAVVRVRAASVHADVWHVVTGTPRVLRLMGAGRARPKNPVPGTDLAGTVESVGAEVTRFKPGDAVFGETIAGMQWNNGGAWAERCAVPADHLALVPDGVSYERAAAIPTSGLIALINLRGLANAGDRVLVNGAGGGVGTMALQIARARGAHVTGVDNAAKQELLRALGADAVIDYAREDFTRGAGRYDLIFDVATTLRLADVKRVLAPGGKYVAIGHDHFGAASGALLGSLPRMIGLMLRGLFDRSLPKPDTSVPPKTETMPVLARLLAEGKLTPPIDRAYPLEGAADALARLASGAATGRLLIAP